LRSQVAPNFKFSGALPRIPLGELTVLPVSLAGGEGARCPSLRTSPRVLALWELGFAPGVEASRPVTYTPQSPTC